jgi:hypothetical protein
VICSVPRVQPAGQRQGHQGEQHPDRDTQFRYINELVKDHQDTADPVISVGAGAGHRLFSHITMK